MLKLQDFYHGERLYLLRCIRHILHCWLKGEHAYKDIFVKFFKKVSEEAGLGKKLLDQFDEICKAPVPTKDVHGPLMGRAQVLIWAHQNLREQAELLELMLIYYKDIEMDLTILLDLFIKFKKHGFGWGQSYKHLVDGQMERLVQRIGYLEVFLLLEGLDIFNAVEQSKEESLTEHVILGKQSGLQKLEESVSKLGSEVIHSPLLLGCSVLQYIACETNQQSRGGSPEEDVAGKLSRASQNRGNQALQLGVFDFLNEILEAEPFCGKTHLAAIAHYLVYSLMSALLSIYHEETLGNTEALYRIASKLFKWESIADGQWIKGRATGGLHVLYESARQWFPLEFEWFVQLNISLAKASTKNAQQVKTELCKLPTYTEPLDNNHAHDLQTTSEQGVFILRRDKRPFQNSLFTIEQKSKGTVIIPNASSRSLGGVNHIIRWHCNYNGWQMLMGEVQELLAQVAQGAGMVQTEQVLKVTMVMELVREILTSDPASVPEFREILALGYQLIARFSVLVPCPIELVSFTIQCLACAVSQLHSEVTHHLRQIGFMPFLMENIDDFSEVLSGDGVNQGLYGAVIAETECSQGIYLVTIATLDLLTEIIKTSAKQPGRNNENLASVLFILRDVFPRYYKWRYVDISHRQSIGQKCLQLFHNILNFVHLPSNKMETDATRGPSLQECCVFSLLFTEAGRSLLEIVAQGVDNVQQALAQQTSLLEGAGTDLIELIEMSLSVLNRLLLLKPSSMASHSSPVEQALASSAQQTPTSSLSFGHNAVSFLHGSGGHQQRHLVAVIAQYIYHRHSHRLPALATLLLKRLAMVSPMSVLACLGKDAESIRDMFLTRLQALAEDIQLKVGILELLSVCVDSQPGLIEIFLNVQMQQGDSTKIDSSKPNLKPGRRSCLPILLDLMDHKRQCTVRCPPELLSACLELVHALWAGLRETPMAVLRQSETFWPSVLQPLKMDLPIVKEDDPVSAQASKIHSKICAFSLRTIALEIFAVSSSTSFKTNLKDVFTGEQLMYWSKAVKESIEAVGLNASTQNVPGHEQSLWDHPALNLLLAWKNFLITVSRFKVEDVQITDPNRTGILHNLLEGIKAQFKGGDLTELKVKLASVSSALYFSLLKIWGRELCSRLMSQFDDSPRTLSTPAATLRNLTQAVADSMGGDTIIPSVLIGLLGSLSLILQHIGQKLDNLPSLLRDLLPVLCSAFLRSSWSLPSLLDKMDKDKDGMADPGSGPLATEFGVHVKLQITCCCLMVEILHNSQDLTLALKVLQEHGIMSSVLATTEAFFKARQGISYVYSSLLLLTKIAETEMGANMLVNSNLTSHLCLVLIACYTKDDSFQQRNLLVKAFSTTAKPISISWHTLYCLSLDLFASCLNTLGHAFLEDALNLVGVHQERMQQSLELARVSLNSYTLCEAEATCNFLMQLCRFQRQWNFHLPQVLARMITSLMLMMQTYAALLIRPRYLLHMLEHHKGSGETHQSDNKLLLQMPAHLQHQTSLDDVDQPTGTLVDTQHSILKLMVKTLMCLKHFTPELPEILLDQGVDVSEWEPVLQLSFGTPSLDEAESGISFGTLLNCVSACIRMLTKYDSRAVSPHRASPDPKQAQVPKPVIQLALELSLQVLLSQACRYLRDPNFTPRDRQFLKRELGTELNSCLSPLHRQMRRGERASSLTPPGSASVQGTPQTPSSGSTRLGLTPQMSRSSSQTFSSTQDPAYFKLVHLFVQKVLK